jgi:hypothetical protein
VCVRVKSMIKVRGGGRRSPGERIFFFVVMDF